MPEISAFKGYRYNKSKIKNLKKVLSPPYDVISKKERERLYGLSPYNFVRLDFKKKTTRDKNVYQAAARDLRLWIDKNITVKENEDAFYVYEQDYKNLEGKESKRIGFICLVKLKGTNVQKHEKTLDGPKKDRTSLLKTIKSNLSPIFTIVKDPKKEVYSALLRSSKSGCVCDETIAGVRHRVYLEKDPRNIAGIKKALKKRPIMIADGHHRFEVSYKNKEKFPYIMAYLCPDEGNDLTIYPTHRVLNLKPGWEPRLRNILQKHFIVWQVKPVNGNKPQFNQNIQNTNAFTLIFRHKKRVYSFYLTPKKKTRLLDVALAQELLIKPLLGVEDIAKTDAVSYTRDAKSAINLVKSGEADAAVMLSKIPVSEVIRLSEKGVFLPQKSTYFYPKLLSGLVFYKF